MSIESTSLHPHLTLSASSYLKSNAEYVVCKRDGTLLEAHEFMQHVVPNLQKQFPRALEVDATLSNEEIQKLNTNEYEYIRDQLKDYEVLPIPIQQINEY